jgi:hypothetical protein
MTNWSVAVPGEAGDTDLSFINLFLTFHNGSGFGILPTSGPSYSAGHPPLAALRENGAPSAQSNRGLHARVKTLRPEKVIVTLAKIRARAGYLPLSARRITDK